FIERMVQTVKQCMRKCAAAGHDPSLAMLIYRATPLTISIPSPAELLHRRKYRALLPTKSKQVWKSIHSDRHEGWKESRNHYIFTSKRDVLQSSKYNYYDEKCLTAKYSA
ncbi:hypothetical protein pdam_00023950, partial [Pocillopora damicornis]